MTFPRETLMAFVDGELSEQEMGDVAAEIARNPELRLYVEEQKALRASLGAAFAPILSEPVPSRLEQAVRETPVPRPKPLRESAFFSWLRRIWESQSPAMRLSWVPVGAMAAGIVLGVLLTNSFDNTDMRDQSGNLFAQGELASALSSRLAADETGDGQSRVSVSFFSKDGFFCRSFTSGSGQNRLGGIACREGNSWRIAAVASAPAQPTGPFSTAGSDMPASIRSTLNEMIAGEPLDAAAERAARNQGWRAR